MIYTVTLNPSIDYIVHVDDMQLGKLNHMNKSLKVPGGKGINVSRILQRLDSPSTALGFLGGFTGEFIADRLDKEGIRSQFTWIAEDSRINIKLKGAVETEINNPGPQITAEEAQALKAALDILSKDDIVILSGSVPPSLPKGFYQDLIALIQQKKAQFVIDTTGVALLQALSYQPLLIKPNNDELAALYHTSFASVEDIIPYGKKLVAAGAQNVIISMGSAGALFFNGREIYQAEAVKGVVKNSVGAGDSMIAGFISGYEDGRDLVDAFRLGVACGSATAFSEDLAKAEEIRTLLPKVTIKQL